MGYSQEDAQLMENLQNDMKKYCDESDNEIKLKGNNHGALPHHDMLLPHWKRFTNELRGRDSVTRVRIRGVSLPHPVLDTMFPALQSMNSLINLTLTRNGLGSEGFIQLSHFLNGNTRLQKLAIVNNVIDDLSVASSLSNAFKNHATLKKLVLSKCGLNNVPILEEILEGCKGVECLAIVKNNLGSEAVALIANFLHSNKTILFLQLHSNKITDDDALVLASIPNENTNLRLIDLKNNDITEEGETHLLKVLYDPTSMDSIVDSNHSCIPYTFDVEKSSILEKRPLLEQEVFMINNLDLYSSIQQKIRSKVVLALCGVDGSLFDLSHLNDLSLQLMPNVLELIQEHSWARTKSVKSMPMQLEKDALSRIFHTLRGWELPLLFENLSPKKGEVGKRKRKRRKTRR